METFGFLLFPQVEELDFAGPWGMLSLWMKYCSPESRCVTVAERRDPIRCSKGLTIIPDTSFESCPPLTGLVIPGGRGTRREVNNDILISFVRTREPQCKAILSVCTGALVLARAGILHAKSATTHPRAYDQLRSYGDITVERYRWARDGRIWTAAGVSAGIDMTLAFIAAFAGDSDAATVREAADYFPYGGGRSDVT